MTTYTAQTASMFQARASAQGREFESAVEVYLKIAGWRVEQSHSLGNVHHADGAEIDIVAVDPDGIRWWIECKGSWEGPSGARGSRRGDTVKKAIAVAWWIHRLGDRHPYMLFTSHLPPADSLPGRMLRAAFEDRLFDRVETIETFGAGR